MANILYFKLLFFHIFIIHDMFEVCSCKCPLYVNAHTVAVWPELLINPVTETC